MLREQLIKGVSEVDELLEVTGAYKTVSMGREISLPEIFSIMRGIFVAEQKLSPAGKQIIDALDIADILDPTFWADLAGPEKARSDRQTAMRFKLKFIKTNLARVINLLRRGTDQAAEVIASEKEGVAHRVKLTLILPEGDIPSSPKRVSAALDGMTDIYSAICSLREFQENTLALIACDSGSDKIFDFSGVGEALREVKELILSIWDRIAYNKQQRLRHNLDVINDALPVLAEIEQLKTSGAMSAQQAELLRRAITKGLEKIIDSGAIVPEMNVVQTIEMRLLASPSPKLLSGPGSHLRNENESSFDVDEDSGFDSEVNPEDGQPA